MKIGLISDIHADPKALRLAIDLLRHHGVEQILCAGDHIERGPNGNEAVRIVQAEGVQSIAGNHDLDAGKREAWMHSNADLFVEHPYWYDLSDQTLAFLDGLPPTLLFAGDAMQVFVAHGTPWAVMQYVFPASSTNVFERLAKTTRTMGAQVLVLGHTHMPMHGVMKNIHIVNPGSVAGAFTNGSRTCAVLTLPDCEFTVYDLESGLIMRPSRPVFEYEIEDQA